MDGKKEMPEAYRRWLLSGCWSTFVHLDYYDYDINTYMEKLRSRKK